jgi:hypothetical protein
MATTFNPEMPSQEVLEDTMLTWAPDYQTEYPDDMMVEGPGPDEETDMFSSPEEDREEAIRQAMIDQFAEIKRNSEELQEKNRDGHPLRT